jgi:NAD(P)-dependent dehydrogenase (short-subunit alcohol dehydrogenase family)
MPENAQGVAYEEMERRYLGQVSLRRMVTPAEVAAMVLFLCSPAGRNLSGQSLGACGHVESLRELGSLNRSLTTSASWGHPCRI